MIRLSFPFLYPHSAGFILYIWTVLLSFCNVISLSLTSFVDFIILFLSRTVVLVLGSKWPSGCCQAHE
jgi:hypothetical protein